MKEDQLNAIEAAHDPQSITLLVAEVRRLKAELGFANYLQNNAVEDVKKAAQKKTLSYRVNYAVNRLDIFLRSCLRHDPQYGDWHGRLSPSLAWSLAGVMAEYADFMSSWTKVK